MGTAASPSSSASLWTLPVNDSCYYCLWVGAWVGVPAIHTAIFSHEAKARYSARNGDLKTPDSYIHCLVTHCATGFNSPHFVSFSTAEGSSMVFFPSPPHFSNFIPASSKFSSDDAEGCKERGLRPTQTRTTPGILLPSDITESFMCAKGQHVSLLCPTPKLYPTCGEGCRKKVRYVSGKHSNLPGDMPAQNGAVCSAPRHADTPNPVIPGNHRGEATV